MNGKRHSQKKRRKRMSYSDGCAHVRRQSSSFINVSTITNQQKLIDKRYEKQNNIGMMNSDLK